MLKKRIEPDERVPLKLTPNETKLILEELICLDRVYEQILENARSGEPVMMTLDDLEEFGGYLAAEANHTEDAKLARRLDRVFDKCQSLLDAYTDERDDAITFEKATQRLAKVISDVVAGEAPAKVPLRIKSKMSRSTRFPLKITKHQRDSLLQFTELKASLKKQVKAAGEGTQVIECTSQEFEYMLDEMCDAVHFARSPHRQRLAAIQKKIDKILEEMQLEDINAEGPAQRRRAESTSETMLQLKVLLLEITPTIWRRIQIKDCTLGELHEHIQLAMGWENYHMHQFTIDGKEYGPSMLNEHDVDVNDESQVQLSDILPASGKRFRFRYEYDFGDSWNHEIVFEGYAPMEKGDKLPHCLAGERACPPEDIGGPWGYAEFVDSLDDTEDDSEDNSDIDSDTDSDTDDADDVVDDDYFFGARHSFDPVDFSADEATRAMRGENTS